MNCNSKTISLIAFINAFHLIARFFISIHCLEESEGDEAQDTYTVSFYFLFLFTYLIIILLVYVYITNNKRRLNLWIQIFWLQNSGCSYHFTKKLREGKDWIILFGGFVLDLLCYSKSGNYFQKLF